MNKKFKCGIYCGLFLLILTYLYAESNKLYVNKEFQQEGDRIYFIQDKETGTRCYAITSSRITTSGYSISCLPK